MKLCLVVGTAVKIPSLFLVGNQGIMSKNFLFNFLRSLGRGAVQVFLK